MRPWPASSRTWAWMAEPEQQTRKHVGVWVLMFLGILSFFAWRPNAAYWKDIKNTPRPAWGRRKERPAGRFVRASALDFFEETQIMMVLYSGTTCPFSQRCRLVLFEKGMDFEIRDVDLFNKPEDIAVMNPYGQVPILVERDLILYESNIINEYIDERFPHPQLMPAGPVQRARAPVPAELREGAVRPRQHARE